MTMTAVRSAYPASIEDLMPKARAMASEAGLPSRNKLMNELRIGAKKAATIKTALEAEGFGPGTAPAGPTDAIEPVEPVVVEPTDPIGVVEPGPVSSQVHDTVEFAAPVVSGVEEIVAPLLEEPVADPDTDLVGTAGAATVEPEAKPVKAIAVWPVLLLLLPATVAIWSGWVGLGSLAGFGPVHPLPGIWDSAVIDTSITLPIGMETYSAYALYVWLSGRAPAKAISFARASALAGLAIGGLGQVAYHLMSAAGVPAADPIITAAVACIPVAVLGMGAALAHLVKNHE